MFFFIMFSLFSSQCLATETETIETFVESDVRLGVLQGVLMAGPAVQFLLVLLVLMSIVSWAIIFSKHKQIKKKQQWNRNFSDHFWQASSLSKALDRAQAHPNSPLARIALSVDGRFLLRDSRKGIGDSSIERILRKASDEEIGRVENRLNFLATTGSTAPFIGLLGTVIGIMNAFQDIAVAGSASLAVVAPGISEALFMTALGLFAALPAVAAFNHFVTSLRKMEIEFNGFITDLLSMSEASSTPLIRQEEGGE